MNDVPGLKFLSMTCAAALALGICAGSRAAEPEAAAPEVSVGIFEPGRWVLRGYGSASFGDEAGEIYQLRAGGERQFRGGLGLELVGMAGYYEADSIKGQPAEEGGVAGLDILLRWYFCRRDSWAMHLDAGAGLAWFESEFPVESGTSFNFEPQVGLGLSHRLGDHWWLEWGARWHHVSNADLASARDNRGYDAAMPYFGFTCVR